MSMMREPDSGAPGETAGSGGTAARDTLAAQAISRYIGDTVPGMTYPQELPEDLRRWYVYIATGGHSIAVVLAGDYAPDKSLGEDLVPAPVKSVLAAGWQEKDGWIVCNLPYSPDTGLCTDPADDEY